MSNASDFVIENGVLKAYKGRAADVEIPKGIKSIGTAAFRSRRSLASIVIPEGVTRIGESAFVGCSGLTCLKIPESVTRIDDRAFALCKGLASITIPSNINIMGNEICADCQGLTSVTILCKTVGKDAFYNCGDLRVFLPNELQYAESAFSKCNCELHLWRWSPETTKLMKDAQIKAINVEYFLSLPPSLRLQTALGLVKDADFDWDSECGKGCLDYLAKSAAKQFSTALDHPALLDFLCDRGLIKAKDLDAYLEEAERRGDVESKVLLLNYQNKLGGAVLKARQKMEKVKEEYANALVERIAARDPSKGIEGMTFVITGKLSDVWESRKEVQAYLESYGANLGSSITKKTDYLVTNDVDSGSEKNRKAKEVGAMVIDEVVFNDLVGKRFKDAPQITIPAWIKTIPVHAFSGCRTLTSVIIPDGVTSIGNNAFYGCSNLVSVEILGKLQKVGKSAFSNCGTVDFICSNPKTLSILNRSFFDIRKGTLIGYRGPARDVEIPKDVTSIGENAFFGCTNLTSLTIPDSVTSIGKSAFSDCTSLTQVTIPKGVTSIGEDTFFGCTSLTSVTIPNSVTSIENRAFCGCSGLVSITIPEGVMSIGKSAFARCRTLTSVIIPDGVTSIDIYTFEHCSSLTSVAIPESVRDIKYKAFYGCINLTIHASSGSYAEQFAKENNIPFAAE